MFMPCSVDGFSAKCGWRWFFTDWSEKKLPSFREIFMELAMNRERRGRLRKVGDSPPISSIEEGICEADLFRVKNPNLSYGKISIKGPRRNLTGREPFETIDILIIHPNASDKLGLLKSSTI